MSDEKKYNRFVRLVLVLVVFVLIYFLAFLMNPFSPSWKEYANHSAADLAIEIALSLLLGWAIIEVSTGIAHWLERRLPWTSSPLRRFLLQTTLTVVSVVFLLVFQDLVFRIIYGECCFSQQESLELWQFFVVSVLVSILVSTVHTGYFLLQRWKTSMSEAADLRVKTLELKEIAMQAELQSLKLQLDPHFMFNNFSTLSELINDDPAVATRFLDNLSRVYRYMIQNVKRDLVQLGDELAFVKAYLYLIRIRHGENVQVTIGVGDEARKRAIPPITLQLLIENAIKHNVATASQPLRITVTADDDWLYVINNLQPIPNPMPSTGTGLANITDRYRILSGRLPEVSQGLTEFTVVLPLLDF
ncbi:sensor histidine kinase [Siphonobacter aquaeclarae]|jgi:two-component system LytT family sensor kinase|uniref:Histidine kinase n=1 Tax=Siphonobacter aquaeclarae TaxID=563176 RepID=A0A1G9HRC6_9BACT|nr:histidine kinase [Siphonobacter aquaeclarae]MBO9638346.1 histidine kinase [Siphonobacter aquaeclarae]SDL15508.1 Histidine kinase [Siphonobacter aquaeclarae]